MTFKMRLTLLAALAAIALPGASYAFNYKAVKGSKIRAKIQINVKAAGDIIARTKKVKGKVSITPAKDGAYKLKGKIAVRIRKLKTGNRSRDRKMWSALGKARQRRIVFLPKSMTLKGNKGKITGVFGINTKTKEVTLDITKVSGNIDGKGPIVFKVTGKLSCADYKIKRPSLMFVKIEDKVDLMLTLKFAPKK